MWGRPNKEIPPDKKSFKDKRALYDSPRPEQRPNNQNSRQNTAVPAKDQTFGGVRVPDNLKRGYLKNIYIVLFT